MLAGLLNTVCNDYDTVTGIINTTLMMLPSHMTKWNWQGFAGLPNTFCNAYNTVTAIKRTLLMSLPSGA